MILTSESDMRDDNTAVSEVAEETADIDASNNLPAGTRETSSEKRGNRKKRGKGQGHNSRKGGRGHRAKAKSAAPPDPTQMIKARFAACGRCCYFLGSYTSAHGQQELETAVQEGLSDWLTLTWDHQTRMLVHKAFGVQLDVDYYHYEGCCVACSRQFSFKSDEEGGATFRVKL